MKTTREILKLIPIIVSLAFFVTVTIAQVKQSRQAKVFLHAVVMANAEFTLPPVFKEMKLPESENFSFDYGIEMPGKDFEIWLQIRPQKENMAIYKRNQGSAIANPDSLYSVIGEVNASAFTGDRKFFTRTIPPDILARYHADLGKSYMLTLLDMPETKHYKYALLIVLQKNKAGTIMAVCFTNEKGPEFFKNISAADNCIKFKS